jgi:hypothetical protein
MNKTVARVIALEEAFLHPELRALYPPSYVKQLDLISALLTDLGPERIRRMDAAGCIPFSSLAIAMQKYYLEITKLARLAIQMMPNVYPIMRKNAAFLNSILNLSLFKEMFINHRKTERQKASLRQTRDNRKN